MKVHTQDDFIVALMALCFQNNVCEEPQTAFFKTVSGMRTDEEKLRLVARAEQLVDDGDPLPTPEELRETSHFLPDMPKDGWELIELQQRAN